eukprot:TRINITY_DN26853_c0_g1_i1.p1 TRINITY_DN26853_c0_g1~~TRINITY_DN26853_c0_g1_i1.p1  ORF type:complete len:251 (-),score=40.06 TRINITY_DN26853_c0_g1_i1:522-1274(-)
MLWPWSCCSVDACKSAEKEQVTCKAMQTGVCSGRPGGSRFEGSASPGVKHGGGTHGVPDLASASQNAGGSGPARVVETVSPLNVPPKTDLADKLETDMISVASSAKQSNRSFYSNASSVGSEFINAQIPPHQREVLRIQSTMKAFVKGMVRGRQLSVLCVDGQLRTCTCSFDRKLRNYSIVINKETRSIELSRFREVFQGTEPKDIATPLDDLCATFVLDNGECLTFRFDTVPDRENFAMCLQIIVDGHH